MVEELLPAWRFRSSEGSLGRAIAFRVYKDGKVLCDDIPLGGSDFVVFGRNPEASHVVLDHQSISRRHAVVFHDHEKRTYLMDLGASHKTIVNGRELEPHAEVELLPGARVQFGKSSREYEFCLLDPTTDTITLISRPPVPLFDAAPAHIPVDAPVRDRGKERQEREREIARMTVLATTGSSRASPVAAVPSSLAEMAVKFGIQEGEDNEDDDEDDDDDEGMGVPQPQVRNKNAQVEKEGEREDEKLSAVDQVARQHRIPVSHQVDLGGFGKAATCLSVEPSGNRVAVGSLDCQLKFFDFGGMDSRHQAFRSVEPEAGHAVVALAHSPTGDRLLLATSGSQPRVLDREGKELLKFIKGDMYLRDMANTKGHTMEVTSVAWHPSDKSAVATGSLDGTLRLWDLSGAQHLGSLVNKTVLKIRSPAGGVQGRVGVTSCCFTHDGSKIVAGCADGSIHIWAPPVFTRTFALLRPAHGVGVAVSAVLTTAAGGGLLASRGADGGVLLWALASVTSASAAPLRRVAELGPSHYATANIDFSPDGAFLIAGQGAAASAAAASENAQHFSLLSFFKVSGNESGAEAEGAPCLQIGVRAGASVIAVKWVAATNQILCSTSAGSVRVFFDPKMSQKGAILSAGRVPPRQRDPLDFAAVGEIINPHALPMYRDQGSLLSRKRKDDEAKKDPVTQKIPAKPPAGPIKRENSSFFFTQYVAGGKKVRV